MNKPKDKLVRRFNVTIKPEIDSLLRNLSTRTGLKMATIIEKGILLFEKEAR